MISLIKCFCCIVLLLLFQCSCMQSSSGLQIRTYPTHCLPSLTAMFLDWTLFRQASKTGKTADVLAEILKIHDEQVNRLLHILPVEQVEDWTGSMIHMSFLNFVISPLCVCYFSDCIKDVNRLCVDIFLI